MSKSTYLTEQEDFWAGQFGDEYVERNHGLDWVASNTALFAKIFSKTKGLKSIIELGPNIGLNIKAIQNLLPNAKLCGVEINRKAADELLKIKNVEVVQESILSFKGTKTFDLSFVKGVLIHINPEELNRVYETLYQSSHRYVLIAEYYNPTPVAIEYRGHKNKLFKRDFAGELLKKYPDLLLCDYGFVYRGDPLFPQDDLTWFLFEKQG